MNPLAAFVMACAAFAAREPAPPAPVVPAVHACPAYRRPHWCDVYAGEALLAEPLRWLGVPCRASDAMDEWWHGWA